MFAYVPERYRGQFAETEEEAARWVAAVVAGQRPEARRPPELLTRDVVARAIRREVREGRGSPHGGVFLDIASRRSAEEIKKKLPSMFHQFKELADVDITQVPMEVGPTCHYMMGGVRVDPETQESTVPGLFAAGEVAAGLHGANRLGGNSLSDLLVFGQRAGQFAAQYAQSHPAPPAVNPDEVDRVAQELLAPFARTDGENPYALHEELRALMQTHVGIVRSAEDLTAALDAIVRLRERAARIKVGGNVQYNPGWHLALDLTNMLDICEVVTLAALERKESRGAHTREDFPDADSQWGAVNTVIRRAAGRVETTRRPLPSMPPELKRLLESD